MCVCVRLDFDNTFFVGQSKNKISLPYHILIHACKYFRGRVINKDKSTISGEILIRVLPRLVASITGFVHSLCEHDLAVP